MVSCLCGRTSQHTFAAQIMKALIKYVLSFLIILWSGFVNFNNPHSEQSLVSHSSYDAASQAHLNEFGLVQFQRTLISVPSSNSKHPIFEVEATETEIEESRDFSSPNTLASASLFTSSLAAVGQGLFLHGANQARYCRDHFSFFTSFSALYIKFRVIRL